MTDDHPPAAPPDPVGEDPLVVTALRHLPVPEHGPGFWDGLDTRLRVDEKPVPEQPVPEQPVPEQPVPPIQLVPVPSVLPAGMRRRSTVALATLAAAAVTVVALAAVTVISRDPDGVDTAGRPDLSEQDPGATGSTAVSVIGRFTGTTASPALGYPGGGSGSGSGGSGGAGDDVDDRVAGVESIAPTEAPSSGEEAAAAFVLAIERGDVDAAWHLLGPHSQAFWATKERFAASGTELAEGSFGSFRAARGLAVSTLVLHAGAQGELGVVTLDGVVALEGDERRRALDLPYRYDPASGAWRVEPWSAALASGENGTAAGPITFRHPAPVEHRFAHLGATDAIEARVPAWATEVTVAVDGHPLEAIRPGAARTVSVQPPDPFAPGVHRLTVTAVGDDGTLAAASLLVLVP